jgi:hypothetical protein
VEALPVASTHSAPRLCSSEQIPERGLHLLPRPVAVLGSREHMGVGRERAAIVSSRAEGCGASPLADTWSVFWAIPTVGSVAFGFLVGRRWALAGPVALVVVIALSGDSGVPWEVIAVLWGVLSLVGVVVGVLLRRYANRLATRP